MALFKFFLLLAFSSLSIGATSEKEVRTESTTLTEIRDVLERGSKEFSAGESHDIVLVLGKTGMGKTTWTHFIAGDRDLTSLGEPESSYESSEGLGNFVIDDGGRDICNETTTSCTSVPKLVLDVSTGTVFYDCPGFDDTRSAAYDIAATYFIHKVVSSAKRVKIVCVIDFNSVRQGGDRSNFKDTAKNIISMIPQIEKFADSIYLVVTKVDGKGHLRKYITSTVARFLKETSKSIQRGGFNQNADVNESIVKFINILLEKSGKEYSRIGIFRSPSEPGLLSGMKLMDEDRNATRDSLLYNLTYTPCEPQDFKYVTADRWKHDLMTKKDDLNGIIVLGLHQAVVHFQKVFDHFVLNQIERPNEIEIQASVAVYQQFSAIRNERLSLDTVVDAIQNACKNLNISTQEKHQITTILEYGQFLEFISLVTDQNLLEKSHLDKALTNLIDYLRTKLLYLSNIFGSLAINGIENITIQFKDSYNQLLDHQLKSPDHFDRVISASLEVFERLSFLQSKNDSLDLEELIKELITNSIILNITTPEQEQRSEYIPYYERYIRSLVPVTGDRSALIDRSVLVNTLTNRIDYLRTKLWNLSKTFTDRIAIEIEKMREQFMTAYSQLLADEFEGPENFTEVINASGRAYKFFSEIHLMRGSLELSSLMAEIKNTFDNLTISTLEQQQRVDIVVEYGQYIHNISSVTGHTSLNPSVLSDAFIHIASYLKTKLLFLSELFSEKIALNINEVAGDFNNWCQGLIISQAWVYNDLEEGIATSIKAQKYLSEFNPENKSLDFEEFMGVITKTMKNLNISIPKQELHTSNIVAVGEYIQLIEGIVGQNSFDRLILVNTMSDLIEHLRGTQQWLEFIKELDRALVSYGVQRNCDKNLILFKKLLHPNRTESVSRNEMDETIEKFIENAKMDFDHHDLPVLSSLNLTYVNSKHVELDELKLRVLVDVLRVDLDTPTTYKCEGDKLSIRGNIVRASSVINGLASCSSNVVAVFAESKLFIDEDIDATGRNLHLTINASTWEIVGTRRIIVDGSPGRDMTRRQERFGICSKEGARGLRGGDAGSFHGSGERCLGCSQLAISANGGRGGNGQDGSDGLDGYDGSYPPMPTFDTNAECDGESNWATTGKAVGTIFTVGIISPFVKYYWYCEVQGERGTKGQRGGPGGAGGYGGIGGIVTIHFADRSEPIINNYIGANGKRGAPGKDGKDGRPGYAYKYTAGKTLFNKFVEDIIPRQLPLRDIGYC